MPTKSVRLKTGKLTINNLILLNNKETDYFNLLKAKQLNNAYFKYLDLNNTKSKRQLVKKHRVTRKGL
jgi:hypothetical protein